MFTVPLCQSSPTSSSAAQHNWAAGSGSLPFACPKLPDTEQMVSSTPRQGSIYWADVGGKRDAWTAIHSLCHHLCLICCSQVRLLIYEESGQHVGWPLIQVQVCRDQVQARNEEQDSAVVCNGATFCGGCQLHTDHGVCQLPREEAICVISQRASLNLSLIKWWQYGLPNTKETASFSEKGWLLVQT